MHFSFVTNIGAQWRNLRHNIFDNNFPYYYVDYFVLKDYYTSEGARCTEFYENLIEANEALGDGDPKSIDQLYKDLKEFITACNNIIRGK